MTPAEALRAAGWRVLDGDEFKCLPPDAHPNASWIVIKKAGNGSLQLMKDRSSVHRQIAALIENAQ